MRNLTPGTQSCKKGSKRNVTAVCSMQVSTLTFSWRHPQIVESTTLWAARRLTPQPMSERASYEQAFFARSSFHEKLSCVVFACATGEHTGSQRKAMHGSPYSTGRAVARLASFAQDFGALHCCFALRSIVEQRALHCAAHTDPVLVESDRLSVRRSKGPLKPRSSLGS